jgi:sugar phosphate isomerase/epimerase
MKLGLMTAAFPTLTLEEVAEWSAANGFETLEIASWPAARGEHRRYAGVSHIDVDRLDERAVHDVLDRHHLAISSLAYYPNNLDGDAATREAAHAHLRSVVLAAQRLGVGVVGTFIGRDQRRSVTENLAEFRKVWPSTASRSPSRTAR